MTLPPANLLAGSASPYLLQHAGNPVHWRPWGPEALAEAAETGKPILLSVGYAACHWCHVMAHESFEDARIAEVMNRSFVNIKVDREERPDVDRIYMAALHALGEQGGWPLTMFLDSAARPFWGGTYFPPEPRWGKPGFPDLLREIARIHAEEPDKVAHNAAALHEHLATRTRPVSADLGLDFLDDAAEHCLGLHDPIEGGTHGAPKFPRTPLLEAWWRAGRRRAGRRATDAVLRTLERMSLGGIWDHLGGGFARYSVDAHWLVPHFEKMLYDNAQLLDLLGRAWSVTGDPLFRSRMEEMVDWLLREMRRPEGGFAAAIDADSEHEEGRFYVWTLDEIRDVLGPDADFFAEAHDVRRGGNWEGRTILNRSRDRRGFGDVDREARLAGCRARLLARRALRIRPMTDDKVLADWNGGLIHSLVAAARRLDRPDWLGLARKAYDFVRDTMGRGDRLAHAWRDGVAVFPGLSGDLAHMARAALTLHETTREPDFLADARRWTAALDRHHADPDGGWFLTADDAEALIVRPTAFQDEATPSPDSIAIENLLRLAVFTGDDAFARRAEEILRRFAGIMVEDVVATASLTNALDLSLGLVEVVLVTPPETDAGALRRAVFASSDTRIVLFEAESTDELPRVHPAHGKRPLDGRPTVWICRRGACGLPTTDPTELAAALERL
ncbi:MAG: thioredoxin domain-containing protein [Siculibacillus sp.]|nr:thioredoxin domain-containing protein [Siculibacillus sp.]